MVYQSNFTATRCQFRDFLRAGAARVIVPVHPSYSETVLHYLDTNEIWNGGDPPTLEDPLYISIVDELKSETGADVDADLNACSVHSGYPCVVDEWEVKLPTTLVYLQPDAELPRFTQRPNPAKITFSPNSSIMLRPRSSPINILPPLSLTIR